MEQDLLLSIFGVSKEDVLREDTREAWANVLGVDRRTIFNWERNIIDGCTERILGSLYWHTRGDRNKLDFYQKFLLMLIAWKQQRNISSYTDISNWFIEVDAETQSLRLFRVNRNEVERWLFQ